MTLRQLAVRLFLALAAFGLVAGCSWRSDSNTADSLQGAQVIGRVLPPGAISASYVDIDAVRQGLGLSARPEGSPESTALRSYVSYAAPIFQFPDGDPLERAVSLEEAREVLAAGALGGPVMVVRTDQSWDDIRTDLVDDGYVEQVDEILTNDSPTVVFSAVGQVGELVVATRDAGLIAASRAPSDGSNDELLALLAAAPGPIRVAILFDGGGCGQEVAVSSDVPTTGGWWTIAVGPGPTQDRVTASPGSTAGRRGQLVLQQPALDGDHLQLRMAFDESIVDPSGWPEQLILSSVLELAYGTDNLAAGMTPPFDTYNCPAR